MDPAQLKQLLPPIIIMAVIMVMFWWSTIAPAKKRAKQHVSLIDAVKEGDLIITVGGVYGKVIKVGDNNFDLEVAPNVRIRFDRRAVRAYQGDRAGDK